MTVFTPRCLLFHVAVTAGDMGNGGGHGQVPVDAVGVQLGRASGVSSYTALSLSGLTKYIYDARTGTYQAQLIAYGLIPGTLLLSTTPPGWSTRVVGIIGLAPTRRASV